MSATYNRSKGQKREPTRHQITQFVMTQITNPASVQYNTTCKFHVSDSGNQCIFGTGCFYLHYKHLDREICPPAPSPKALGVLSKLQSEVGRFGKMLESLIMKVRDIEVKTAEQSTDAESKTEQTKARSASPKKKKAATKAKAVPRSTQSAFATSLSSAFASKKTKSKRSAKKSPRKKSSKTPKFKTVGGAYFDGSPPPKEQLTRKADEPMIPMDEQQEQALEEIKRRISDLNSRQYGNFEEMVANIGLKYRAPVEYYDSDEDVRDDIDGEEVD